MPDNSEKKTYKILDKGFIRLVDYMGSDDRVVQSARVSYGQGTKTVREDRGLIRYLLRNAHTSPFEQVVFTFHIKMPIFVARQWVRHRTARLNEISARYSVMEDELYVPSGNSIGFQSIDNKQARSSEVLPVELQEKVRDIIQINHKQGYDVYKQLLNDGIAREIARITLPTALYTEMYWQIDLHNLFHFLHLRMDSHAQKEIREYACILFDIVKQICPISCEAFEDYVLGKVEFYKSEQKILSQLFNTIGDADIESFLKDVELGKQEKQQFIEKIRKVKTCNNCKK